MDRVQCSLKIVGNLCKMIVFDAKNHHNMPKHKPKHAKNKSHHDEHKMRSRSQRAKRHQNEQDFFKTYVFVFFSDNSVPAWYGPLLEITI